MGTVGKHMFIVYMELGEGQKLCCVTVIVSFDALPRPALEYVSGWTWEVRGCSLHTNVGANCIFNCISQGLKLT